MQLAEDRLPAERVLRIPEPAFAVGGAEIEKVAAMLRDPGQRGARLALGLVGVGDAEQAAQVRVAAEVARDEDQLFAVDLEGAADDRLDAELATGLKMAHGAVDATSVGDGKRRHLELGRAHRQLVGVRAAVQEGEVGVAVELDVRGQIQNQS